LTDSNRPLSARALIKGIDNTMSMDFEAMCRVHSHPRYQRSPYVALCNPSHPRAPPQYIHRGPHYTAKTPRKRPAKPSSTSQQATAPPATTQPVASHSRSGRALNKAKQIVPNYDAKQYATKNAPRRSLSAKPPTIPYVTVTEDPSIGDYLPHQAVNIALHYRHIRQYSHFPPDHPLTSIIPLFPYNGTQAELANFSPHLPFFTTYYNDYANFLQRQLAPDSLEFASIITIILILHLQSSPIPASHTVPALSALTTSDARLYDALFAALDAEEEEKDDNGSMSDAASSTNHSETTSN